MAARIWACVNGTPFGGPVEPDVYIMVARSWGCGGTGSAGLVWPRVRRVERGRIWM